MESLTGKMCIFCYVCSKNCGKRLLASLFPSAWNNTGRTYMIFDILRIFCRRSVDKFQVSSNSDKNNRCLTREHKYVCDNIALNSSQHEMFQTKTVGKNQNTHFVFNTPFF